MKPRGVVAAAVEQRPGAEAPGELPGRREQDVTAVDLIGRTIARRIRPGARLQEGADQIQMAIKFGLQREHP